MFCSLLSFLLIHSRVLSNKMNFAQYTPCFQPANRNKRPLLPLTLPTTVHENNPLLSGSPLSALASPTGIARTVRGEILPRLDTCTVFTSYSA